MGSIIVNTANVCNFHCEYCEPRVYNEALSGLGLGKYTIMPQKVFEEVVSTLVKSGLPYDKFVITGGEPTLDGLLNKKLKYALKHGVHDIWVNSNGFNVEQLREFSEQITVCLSYHHGLTFLENLADDANSLKGNVVINVPVNRDYDIYVPVLTDLRLAGFNVRVEPLYQLYEDLEAMKEMRDNYTQFLDDFDAFSIVINQLESKVKFWACMCDSFEVFTHGEFRNICGERKSWKIEAIRCLKKCCPSAFLWNPEKTMGVK